jgi:hypothetical protein
MPEIEGGTALSPAGLMTRLVVEIQPSQGLAPIERRSVTLESHKASLSIPH